MLLPITTLSLCILAVLLFVLSVRVIGARRSEQVSLGDAGNEILQRRIRGHGNLVEYGPIGVLLILAAELQGANPIILAVIAAAFVLGRLLHGYAFAFELLSNLVFEVCWSCGDLTGLRFFNSVFEPDACDDFWEVLEAS